MKHNNLGFTLIEVLIAMLVLATGLLGLAGLQARGLSNTQSAYNRSQATQLAYDMADRMRANPLAAANYVTTFMEPSAATVKSDCLTTTGCSAANMAENDLYEWNCAVAGGCESNDPPIAAVLPGGSAGITVDAAIYTITITWDDDHNDDSDNSLSFQTSFQL